MWGNKTNDDKQKRPKYKESGKLLLIPCGEIVTGPDQPRRDFDYQKLLELAQSISETGLLHPLLVTFREGKPVLISGERRLRAAKIAGLREIPCLEREADSQEAALLA